MTKEFCDICGRPIETQPVSPFMAYDQYRPIRGKIAIWTKDGIVNKLMQ